MAGRTVPLALVAALAVLWMVELLWAPHYKPVFAWHSVTGYMAFIGLAGCGLMTLVAKFIGKKYLQRPAEPEQRPVADDVDGAGSTDQAPHSGNPTP